LIIILTSFTSLLFYFDINNRTANDVAIVRGNDQSDKVALTFNLSWGNEEIYRILHTLYQNNIQANFFISGEWAEGHPHILDEIIDGKHEIGLLGYRFTNYLNDDLDVMKQDITTGYDTLKKFEIKPNFIRAPKGQFHDDLKEHIKQFDLHLVHYTTNSKDLEAKNEDDIVKQLIKTTENGSIILMHGSDSALFTAEALEKALPRLKKQFNFVSLSQLFHDIDIEEEQIN